MNLEHETADVEQAFAPFECKHCGNVFEPTTRESCPERLIKEAVTRTKEELKP